MVTLENKQVYGSISYIDWLQADVQRGKDRRFYVPTVRGLRVGEFLNIHGNNGYGGGVTRACVKPSATIPRRRCTTSWPTPRSTTGPAPSSTTRATRRLIHMMQTSHNDNQTYD